MKYLSALSKINIILIVFSLTISMLIYPSWLRIFDYGHPINVTVNENTIDPIQVNFERTKSFYENTAILTADQETLWDIKFRPLGSKNFQSQSYEVWITNIETSWDGKTFEKIGNWKELAKGSKEWILRDWNGPLNGAAIFTSGNDAPLINIKSKGKTLRISLLCGPWSGKVEVEVNGKSQEIDLFNIVNREKVLTINTAQLKKTGIGEYEISQGDLSGQKISFTVGRDRMPVKKLSFQGKEIQPDKSNIYEVPRTYWSRDWSARLLTVVTFSILLALTKLAYRITRRDSEKKIHTLLFALLVSLTFATFWVLVFYPAAMSTDATSMWVKSGSGFQAPGGARYDTWFPPLNAILMNFFQIWTKNPSLFALCQGFLLWFSIIFTLREIIKNERSFVVCSVLLLCFPPLWNLSFRILHDVWCASFALFSIAFLIRYIKQFSKIDFVLSLTFLSLSICFRHNAISLVICPIFVCLFFDIWKCSTAKKFLLSVVVIVVSILPSKIIDHLPDIQRYDMRGVVFMNQYVGAVKNSDSHTKSGKIESERRSIDEHFGDGTFDKLSSSYTCTFGDYIWASDNPIISQSKLRDSSNFIVSKVISSIQQYPLGYIRHRLCHLSYLLQIPRVTSSYYHEIQFPDLIQRQESQLPLIRKYVVYIVELLGGRFDWVYRTWIFLAMSSIIFVISLNRKNVGQVTVGIFSIVYFLSYLIPEATPDWRYLILSYICSIINIIGYVEQRFSQRLMYLSQK